MPSWGEERLLTVNGAQYRLLEAGRGHPVLLLHGFTGTADSWAAIAAPLAESHRVVAVDLLGHGASDAPTTAERYGMDPTTCDLAAILTVLGIERTAVVGYSMGGRIALGFAAAFPMRVSSLVLESATAGIADPAERAERRRSDAMLAETIERDGIEAFVDQWERLPLFASQSTLPDSVQQTVRQGRLAQRPHGLANSLRGIGQGSQPPLHDQLGEIACPTLLLVGEEDAKFRRVAADLGSALPNASTVVAAGAGHNVHLEQPERFAATVLSHLAASERQQTERIPQPCR